MSVQQEVVEAARYLHERGLTHGSTGNVSVRDDDGLWITPTNSSLRTVQAEDLSLVSLDDGRQLAGHPPSKEAFLHTAVLRARPQDRAVVHTHSTYSAAVSCLAGLDPDDAVPALTAYFVMRVGRVVLLPYHAPGDTSLGPLAEAAAADAAVLLLRNHGPVIAAPNLGTAIEALEELEETARLFLLLHGLPTTPLTAEQRAAIQTAARPERTPQA